MEDSFLTLESSEADSDLRGMPSGLTSMIKQIFIGPKKPNKASFKSPFDRSYFNKPDGGLWTSSLKYCEDCAVEETDWHCWAKESIPQKIVAQKWYELIPSPEARVYHINNTADFMYLVNEYNQAGASPDTYDGKFRLRIPGTATYAEFPKPASDSILNTSHYLSFVRLSSDFDAIHLSDEGVYGVGSFHGSLLPGLGLYSWGVESTVWLNWCFDKVSRFYPKLSSTKEKSNTI